MRFLLSTMAVIASIAAVSASMPGTPTTIVARGIFKSINPPTNNGNTPARRNGDDRSSHFDTNAKRLAAGMPLKAPNRRFAPNRVHSPRQTGTPSTNGYILVALDGTPAGYLSNALNGFGEYTATSSSCSDPNTLTVSAPLGQSGSVDILAINSELASVPFFGAISGWSSTSPDLGGDGNYNYIYLGQIGESASPDSPATDGPNSFSTATDITEPTESGIWRISPNGNMDLWWTNGDGRPVETTLIYVQNVYAAVASDDLGNFEVEFGSTYNVVTLTYSTESCA